MLTGSCWLRKASTHWRISKSRLSCVWFSFPLQLAFLSGYTVAYWSRFSTILRWLLEPFEMLRRSTYAMNLCKVYNFNLLVDCPGLVHSSPSLWGFAFLGQAAAGPLFSGTRLWLWPWSRGWYGTRWRYDQWQTISLITLETRKRVLGVKQHCTMSVMCALPRETVRFHTLPLQPVNKDQWRQQPYCSSLHTLWLMTLGKGMPTHDTSLKWLKVMVSSKRLLYLPGSFLF